MSSASLIASLGKFLDQYQDRYAELLFSLLPPGRAFNRERHPKSVLGEVLHALAGELARVGIYSDQLFREVLPSTAETSFSLHEEDLDLPEECLQYYSTLTEQEAIRRIRAVEKFIRYGSTRPEYYEQLVEDLYEIVTAHVKEYGEWTEGDQLVEIAPPYVAPIYESDFRFGVDGWGGSTGASRTGNIDLNADGAGIPPTDNWLRILRTGAAGGVSGWTEYSGISEGGWYKITFKLFIEAGSPIKAIRIYGRASSPWTAGYTLNVDPGVNSCQFIGRSPSDLFAIRTYNAANSTFFATGTRWYIQDVIITPYTAPRYEKAFFLTSLFQWVLMMVYPDRPEPIRLSAGEGRAGDTLQYTPADRPVACLVDKYKPAHTQALVTSGNPFSTAFSVFETNAIRTQQGHYAPGFDASFDCIPGGYSDIDYWWWFPSELTLGRTVTHLYIGTNDNSIVIPAGTYVEAAGTYRYVTLTTCIFSRGIMAPPPPYSELVPVIAVAPGPEYNLDTTVSGQAVTVYGYDDALWAGSYPYITDLFWKLWEGPTVMGLPMADGFDAPEAYFGISRCFGIDFAKAFKFPLDQGAFSDAFTDAFRIRNLSFWIPWRGSFNNQAFAFGFNRT